MEGRATSVEEMEELGRKAAEMIHGACVLGLVGGLGAGKTHWTKGLVAGLGAPADVTSPTFGLIHEYPGGRLPVVHADFYRLEKAEELIAIGWDEYLETPGVVIAEWAGKFPGLMPKETTWLFFRVEPDGSRTVSIGEGPAGCG
jgi:tRNA threonylcarbamoyladenosine biosynthesis protein TsaE